MPQLLRSWIDSANSADTGFPLNNLPYGAFHVAGGDLHAGVAIGDYILNVTALEQAYLLDLPEQHLFALGTWNDFMALAANVWTTFRAHLTAALAEGATQRSNLESHLVAMADATLEMAFSVTEFTDFYAGRHHAFNVGSLFRDPANALPPNWLHIPIGYNGRASSFVVSDTDITCPNRPAQSTRHGDARVRGS
jgi:fumarylacetoacetase